MQKKENLSQNAILSDLLRLIRKEQGLLQSEVAKKAKKASKLFEQI